MAHVMSENNANSPAARAMSEAIELAIEVARRTPMTRRLSMQCGPRAGEEITKAVEEGRAVVLVSTDGAATVLRAVSPRR
jgi:hypothetical protein